MSDQATETVDAVGVYCPMPIILLSRAVKGGAIGDTVEVLADDPGIESDLPNWCKGSGQECVSLRKDEEGVFHGVVKKIK